MSASFDGEGSQEPKEDPAGHLNSDITEDDDDDDYEDHDDYDGNNGNDKESGAMQPLSSRKVGLQTLKRSTMLPFHHHIFLNNLTIAS